MQKRVVGLILMVLLTWGAPVALWAEEMPSEYQAVLSSLGRKGDYKDGVLKIGLPRDDLRVTVAGLAVPTAFGFSGWIAMTRGDGGKSVMMGDLVLVEDEVNPVMSALLEQGLDVTALHNHFFWEKPRVFFMHVHGFGAAADLARRVKPGLSLMGKGARPAGGGTPNRAGRLDTARLSQIIGHPGEEAGGVTRSPSGGPTSR